MKISLHIILVSILLAGGWNQKKGHGFFKYELRYLSAKKFYTSTGETIPITTVTSFSNALYGEYGLSDDITLIATIPFQSILLNRTKSSLGTSITDGGKNTGLGDISVGIRYGLSQKGQTVYAAFTQIDLPTGDGSHALGLYTGDDETNVRVGLELGHSSGDMYLTASGGYNFRSKDFFNEALFTLELGHWFGKSILSAVKLRGVYPSGTLGTGGFNQAFQQSEYTAYTLEANYFVTKEIGVSLAYDSAFAVKNNFATPVYSFGVFYKL